MSNRLRSSGRIPFLTVVAALLAALFSPSPTALTRTQVSGPARPAPVARFDWPLSPIPRVSRPFQPPSRPYGPGHRGADLSGSPGQPVHAAGDGVVVYAGPLARRGVVSVDHADGLRTTYEPVTASVRPGRLVHTGESLGTLESGHLGCPAPACLHWGLRREHTYLDPLLLVRRVPVRLLPWSDLRQASGEVFSSATSPN